MENIENTRSVDDLLVKVQNEQLSDVSSPSSPSLSQPEPQPVPEVKHQSEPEALEKPEVQEIKADSLPETSDEYIAPVTKEDKAAEISENNDSVDSSPIDEYGNPIEKPKTYTEEEVQRMIRDRLSRGKHAEMPQSTQQQVQQDADGFKADPNSEESWEIQLEQFIEKTIEKRQTKQTQVQWRQQEAAKQAEFEAKFNTGMNKYQDFYQVVSGKPITDSMMMATRNLENPAAFVYAASKMHASELDRIARIPDSAAQMVEIGRLHEKMIKERRAVSNAPKPVALVKGDMPVKQHEYPSIDYRIQQHAKQKLTRFAKR